MVPDSSYSDEGLRTYEKQRRERTAFVTKQSWSLGKVFQFQNPIAVWLRNWSMRTRYGQRQGERVFEKLLSYEVPELTP